MVDNRGGRRGDGFIGTSLRLPTIPLSASPASSREVVGDDFSTESLKALFSSLQLFSSIPFTTSLVGSEATVDVFGTSRWPDRWDMSAGPSSSTGAPSSTGHHSSFGHVTSPETSAPSKTSSPDSCTPSEITDPASPGATSTSPSGVASGRSMEGGDGVMGSVDTPLRFAVIPRSPRMCLLRRLTVLFHQQSFPRLLACP